MKQKKILTSLIIFAVALAILFSANNVQAASSKLNLGVTKTRYESVVNQEYPTYKHQYESTDGSATINVWKLVSYPKAGAVQGQIPDSSKAIYCLRAGLGFNGAFDNALDYSTQAIEYSQVYNLKNTDDLVTLNGIYPTLTVFDSTSDNYRAVLWLLDNAYIPGESTQAEKDDLLKRVIYNDPYTGEPDSIYNWMKATENTNDDITDSDVDMIQQLAIWYFTNNDTEAERKKYYNDTLNTLRIKYQASADSTETSYGSYNDIFRFEDEDRIWDYGRFRFNYLNELYKYLITTAKEQARAGYVGNEKTVAAVYLSTNSPAENQPVVVIDRKERILDLSLRKFVSEVERDGKEIAVSSREPQVDTSKLVSGESTTATYNQTKTPLAVEEGDIITYTLRIYNEGNVDAKVTKVKDYLPSGLTYANYSDLSWEMQNARIAESSVLCTISNVGGNVEKFCEVNGITESEIKELLLKDAIIPAFEEGKELNYIDVLIKCKVEAAEGTLVNIAKIAEEESLDKFVTKDRDSDPDDKLTIPSDSELQDYTGGKNQGNDPCFDGSNVIDGKYYPGQQDDDDFEKIEVKPKQLDLSLVKFVSGVNGSEVTEREPRVDTTKLESGESTDATYTQVREPYGVEYGDIVTYTIRVYNEGRLSGYAAEITDNIPEGLEYIIDSEINNTYGWVMLDAEGNVTENLEEAVYITTNYLSKEKETSEGSNLIKAFNIGEKLNYKEVKIQFKVASSISGKALKNEAQVSKETDEEGNDTPDRDSTLSLIHI